MKETKPDNTCKTCGHDKKKHHIDRPNGNLVWCDGFRCICDKFIQKETKPEKKGGIE